MLLNGFSARALSSAAYEVERTGGYVTRGGVDVARTLRFGAATIERQQNEIDLLKEELGKAYLFTGQVDGSHAAVSIDPEGADN